MPGLQRKPMFKKLSMPTEGQKLFIGISYGMENATNAIDETTILGIKVLKFDNVNSAMTAKKFANSALHVENFLFC